MDTTDSAVIVTGASRGIGRGIAVALAAVGYSVGINYVRNSDAAEATVQACSGVAPDPRRQRFIPLQADIGVKNDRERLVEASFREFPSIRALVNNAGVAPKERKDIVQASEESFEYVLRTNLQGPYFLTQAFVSRWLGSAGSSTASDALDKSATGGSGPADQGGRGRSGSTDEEHQVVYVGSISADTVSLNRGEYCVAKAGIAMAVKLWAARLARDNVHVFEVRPGIMETDMTSGVKEKYDRLFADGTVPQPRWGTPEDVADIVVSLVSGAFRFATGSVIHSDGGFHISRL